MGESEAEAVEQHNQQRFRWLDLLRGPEGRKGPAGEERERLRAQVARARTVLPPKGPIHGFVAQNPLQGLEYLPFDRAVREAQRLLGGQGYLSNEGFRRLYGSGRITRDGLGRAVETAAPHLTTWPRIEVRGRRVEARDVCLAQLLHELTPLAHGTLRWQVFHAKTTSRFRQDVPPETRSMLLQRAAHDLETTLARVGEEWTLAEWVHAHTAVDLVGRIRERIGEALRSTGQRGAGKPFWEAWRTTGAGRMTQIATTPREYSYRCLEELQIPQSQQASYLYSIEKHYSMLWETDRNAPVTREEFAALWLHEERQLLRSLPRRSLGSGGTLAAIERHCRQDLKRYAVSALWAAVLMKLGVADPVAIQDQEARVAEAHLHQVLAVARDGLPQRGLRADLVRNAREALERDIERIGPEYTLGDFCQRLTGATITGAINDQMIRWCAAFLDEGLAGWPMPDRERGFYEAWRKVADRDLTCWFLGIKGFSKKIRQLPSHAEDAVIQSLRTMGIPEKVWTEYLTLHLAALPGWAGIIGWRETHPIYEMQQHHPIDLTQYLAVRLFYEVELVFTLCRGEWDIQGTVPALHAYFLAHPGEYVARSQVAAGSLSDLLAGGVVGTAQGRIALNWDAFTHRGYGDMRRARGLSREDQWFRFAEMLYADREGVGEEHHAIERVYHDGWRLFHLAQILGLSAEDIRALPPEAPNSLLDLLDELPPATHGPIWLEAFETHYRDQLLTLLSRHQRIPERRGRPRAQLIFCLDMREEGIRRHVEAQSEEYETLGTAGFFTIPMILRPLATGIAKPSCPIPIDPRHTVVEGVHAGQGTRETRHTYRKKWKEALHGIYHRLETNFATAYSLIDLLGVPFGITVMGRTLLPRKSRVLTATLRDTLILPVRTSLRVDRPTEEETREELALIDELRAHGLDARHHAARLAEFDALGFSLKEQVDLVEAQLRMIGLTDTFARLILFCGHGATTENNPYAAAYHCGACGGSRGGHNGRAIAAMLNNPQVRALLARRGIPIPEDTHFLGAEHDTAAERFTYFDTEDLPPTHREEFRCLAHDLYRACGAHAQERCRHLPLAPENPSPEAALRHVHTRSVDWAQVYPEWGHARC
ncbi:MAG: putative inorganic carbon transporter subunit DabA, partial [Candidatus Methylomirabilales bacterium]